MQEQIKIFISSCNDIDGDNDLPNHILHGPINTMEFNFIHVTKNCMIKHVLLSNVGPKARPKTRVKDFKTQNPKKPEKPRPVTTIDTLYRFRSHCFELWQISPTSLSLTASSAISAVWAIVFDSEVRGAI